VFEKCFMRPIDKDVIGWGCGGKQNKLGTKIGKKVCNL
jgi:hypothetical protein